MIFEYIEYISMFFVVFGFAVYGESDTKFREGADIPPKLFILNFMTSSLLSYLVALILYDISDSIISSTAIGALLAFQKVKTIQLIIISFLKKVLKIKGDSKDD